MFSNAEAWALRQPIAGSDEHKESTLQFLELSISTDTKKSYEVAYRYFTSMGLEFPLTGMKLVTFIKGLVESTTLVYTTISKYTSGLKTLNQLRGFGGISVVDEKLVERALQSARKIKPPQAIKQAPIIPETVAKKLFQLPIGELRTVELEQTKDAILLGISLALRPGELLGLRARDIISKIGTPENATGTTLEIDLGVTKVGNFELITRECLLSVEQCGKKGLWCAVHRIAKLAEVTSPCLRIFDKVYKKFTAHVRLLGIELNKHHSFPKSIIGDMNKFTGHSCRRSSATYMLRSGMEKDDMKTACRWRSDQMVLTYTREESVSRSRGSANKVREHLCG